MLTTVQQQFRFLFRSSSDSQAIQFRFSNNSDSDSEAVPSHKQFRFTVSEWWCLVIPKYQALDIEDGMTCVHCKFQVQDHSKMYKWNKNLQHKQVM
jgi:hypothetical protein